MYAGADERNFRPMAQEERFTQECHCHKGFTWRIAHMAKPKFEPTQFIPKIATTVVSWLTRELKCSFCLRAFADRVGPRAQIFDGK